MVTICTASLTFNNSTFCPHTVFMCFVWISEQTVIISLYNYLTGFYNRDLTLYSPVVTICTTSVTFNNSTFCPHSVFMCFVWISEQTAIISLYNINWLVFITQTHGVYCAVRTGSLHITAYTSRPESVTFSLCISSSYLLAASLFAPSLCLLVSTLSQHPQLVELPSPPPYPPLPLIKP